LINLQERLRQERERAPGDCPEIEEAASFMQEDSASSLNAEALGCGERFVTVPRFDPIRRNRAGSA